MARKKANKQEIIEETDVQPTDDKVATIKPRASKRRRVRSRIVKGPGGTTYIKEDFINF